MVRPKPRLRRRKADNQPAPARALAERTSHQNLGRVSPGAKAQKDRNCPQTLNWSKRYSLEPTSSQRNATVMVRDCRCSQNAMISGPDEERSEGPGTYPPTPDGAISQRRHHRPASSNNVVAAPTRQGINKDHWAYGRVLRWFGPHCGLWSRVG